MIVEDDEASAEMWVALLMELGYGVVGPAETKEQALEIAAASQPDLVLMDIHLKNEDSGIDTARALRERYGNRLPVVFLSGHSDPKTLSKAMEVEPFGYLIKPVDAKALHAAIEVALVRQRAESAKIKLANTDLLTGLLNRQGFETVLRRELSRARRLHIPVSILFIDIDDFKRVNDTCGHAVGDEVLQGVANIIRRTTRITDVAVRWGGDEFLVLLEGSPLAGAASFAERLRMSIENLYVPNAPSVTVSIGIAEWNEGDFATTLARADGCLYEAKDAGKNRLCWLEPGGRTDHDDTLL